MSVGTADVWKALAAAWVSSGLDATFKALWPSSVDSDAFVVLNDQDASPGQPFPYVLVEQFDVGVANRSSGSDGGASIGRHVRESGVMFHVYAKQVDGDDRSGKEIAADLAEEVMKQFGGHPTVVPQASMSLTYGNHLINRFVTDYGMWQDDVIYRWTVAYEMITDVPVALAS